MQGAMMQRSSAFSGASLRSSAVPTAARPSRSTVNVQAVQDLKGFVVSTACSKTAVVGGLHQLTLQVLVHDAGPNKV